MKSPQFEIWRIRNNGENYDLSAVRESYSRAKASRAEIIDAMTLIELELNDFLCLAIVGDNSRRAELFSNCVLTAEFCSLFQKWRMLRTVLADGQSSAGDRKKELAQLKVLIGLRNAFAHGEIVVDTKTHVATLTYREGERKSLVIDHDTVASALDDAMQCFRWLAALSRERGQDQCGVRD